MYLSLVGLLFLLICGPGSCVILQFFVPDQNARNSVTLECIADGLPQDGATYQFFSGLDESTLQSVIFSESDRLEVTVEHTSEQFIRCVLNGEMSNFLTIAALPDTTEFEPAMVHVFRDEEATITCPFMLGNLREHFDPYEITWTKNDGGSPLTLTEPDGPFQISPDGRELRLPISDPMNTATYQCMLRVSRCTMFDENNDVSDRCEIESPFMGPATSLIVAERTEPTTLPEDSEVMIGERANFTCNAFGSFIAIFWRFNNSLLNCNESGCDNRAAFVQERNISYSDVNGNSTIESTLEINTEGFPLRNFVIACIITQDEPEYVQGAGTPDGIFSSLLMLRNEGVATEMSTVPSSTTPSSAQASSGSALGIIIIVLIIALL